MKTVPIFLIHRATYIKECLIPTVVRKPTIARNIENNGKITEMGCKK